MSLANVAILSGQDLQRALAAVREQKLLGEELPAAAWLQAAMQDTAGAERSLREYAAARPWLSAGHIGLRMAMNQSYAALVRKSPDEARAALERVPDEYLA